MRVLVSALATSISVERLFAITKWLARGKPLSLKHLRELIIIHNFINQHGRDGVALLVAS